MLLVICLAFLVNLHCFTCYYCLNKQINVHGTASPSEIGLYNTFGSDYSDFRISAKLTVNFLATKDKGIEQSNGTLFGKYFEKDAVFSTLYNEFLLDNTKIIFPIASMPLIVIHNLPNVVQLNLTIQNLADIYKGTLKYWNDIRLTTLNPNIVLPNERILPIARKDDDTTTAVFTEILSNFDQEWNSSFGIFKSPNFSNKKCCNSTTWSPNVQLIFGLGSVGMIGLVASHRFSIGYSTLNTVTKYSVNIANIFANDSAYASYPTISEVQMAMQSAWKQTTYKNLHMQISSSAGYPLTSYTYIAMQSTYKSSFDCCVIQEMVGFLHWVFTTSDDEKMFELGYVPLINDIKLSIMENALKKIGCQQGPVLQSYMDTITGVETMPSWQLALIVAGAFGAAGLIACLGNFAYQQKFNVDINRFIVESVRIKIIESKRRKNKRADKDADPNADEISDIGSIRSKLSQNSSFRSHISANVGNTEQGVVRLLKEFMTPGNLDETNKVYLDSLVCKIPQQWSMVSKRTLAKLKNVVDKNVSMLLGITVINYCPWAIFEHCSKGTLHYVLRTSRYNINDSIKMQFAFGIATGLRYLHQYHIVHGFLSSLTCYLDISWTIKICQWEKCALYEHENIRDISEFAIYEQDANFDEIRLIELLYVEPELSSKVHDPSVDVYSFGFLIVEIFTRKLPYLKEIEDEGIESFQTILHKKFIEKKTLEPSAKYAHSPELHNITLNCIGPAEDRVKISQICSYLQKQTKKSSGIVDIIMDALEAHNDFLEEKVNERTAELHQMTDKMRDLLNEVLPPQIAEKLLAGIPVLPEFFESVTIYFSDIVGFTTISARSSPIEVMTFLNDLWLSFDTIMDQFDVYKVDTIGDAYLVCSGLPNRNGVEHSRQIALMALGLRNSCETFKIRHLPEDQMKIRIGINSGPCGAGVIGAKLPQYCVFGDTVNTATTMESTSMALKIQVSLSTYTLLNENFPDQFDLEYRGVIQVDGKADIQTWWLNKENEK